MKSILILILALIGSYTYAFEPSSDYQPDLFNQPTTLPCISHLTDLGNPHFICTESDVKESITIYDTQRNKHQVPNQVKAICQADKLCTVSDDSRVVGEVIHSIDQYPTFSVLVPLGYEFIILNDTHAIAWSVYADEEERNRSLMQWYLNTKQPRNLHHVLSK